MNASKLSVGDVVAQMYDSGTKAEEIYARVLVVGDRMVKVRSETGDEGWQHPAVFHRIVPADAVPSLGIDWR